MASAKGVPSSAHEDPRRFKQQINAATKLPFAEASEFFRGKAKIVETKEWREMMREQHDRAFTVAGLACESSLKGIRRLVQKAIDEGQTEKDFRKSLQAVLEENGAELRGALKRRAKVIFDTNIRTSYAAGRLRQLEAAKSVSPYWVYRHGGSANPRPEHLAMDGKVLPADDPAWKLIYPPNGWGCSCVVEAVSERQLKKMGGLGKNKLEVKYGPDGLPAGVEPGWDYQPGATADPFSGETRDPDKTFAGRRRLEESGQRWAASLTPDERAAVGLYTDFRRSLPGAPAAVRKPGEQRRPEASAFEEINGVMRGTMPASRSREKLLRKQARAVESALRKFKTEEDLVVYRGVGVDAVPAATSTRAGAGIKSGESLLAGLRRIEADLTGGAQWIDPGFSSTSVSKISAFEHPVVLRIRIRKGVQVGAFVKFASETAEQDEFLFVPGAKLQVRGCFLEWRASGSSVRPVLVLDCNAAP